MANSIMTNASAMTALKTLNLTNKSLEQTQGRIATGYRVAEAADNAAYWSIATTMRSDNKALSTVNDALGLGKATVDVAYTALDSSKKVLDDIKTKLVAAKQPGVDKSKVQTEITQLKNQLQGIASAASFSGSNWLSVDSSQSEYNASQQVVASFSRNGDGSLSIGTIDIDITKVALFDAAASSGSGATLKGVGLLEQGTGSTAAGSLAASGTTGVTTTAGQAATAAKWTATADFAFPNTGGTVIDGDDIVINIGVDAIAAADYTIDIADAQTFTLDTLVAGINNTTTLKDQVSAANVDGRLVITSKTTGAASQVDVNSVSIQPNGGGAARADQFTGIANATPALGQAATSGKADMTATFASAITLDEDDTISFDLSIDGGNAQKVTIDRTLVNTTLSVTDGSIDNATEMRDVLNAAFTGAVVSLTGGKLTFTSNGTGAASSINITNLKASNGGNSFSVMDVDITNADAAKMDEYIAGIDAMAKNVTTAASDLGSVKSRIGMQTDFVSDLMDAIDRGVGQLVDADMNEESTRLQALQVQQQLGVQALSMANSSSQSLLSLFRG